MTDGGGLCLGEQPTKATGLRFPRRMERVVFCWKKKVVRPSSAPEARRLGGGHLCFKQILRNTLEVLMINLIHAQMWVFFFLKHIAFVLK